DSATDAEIMNNLFKLYDRVISDWKGKDLDYVKLFLEDKTYQEVAQELGVNLTSAGALTGSWSAPSTFSFFLTVVDSGNCRTVQTYR
ncbi:MAG: hypothetical protein MUF68_06450, partial [Cyclobacteriaceae bacterium]|nr:hypothetical protein [Cyclobacteriaceae bacterium]